MRFAHHVFVLGGFVCFWFVLLLLFLAWAVFLSEQMRGSAFLLLGEKLRLLLEDRESPALWGRIAVTGTGFFWELTF